MQKEGQGGQSRIQDKVVMHACQHSRHASQGTACLAGQHKMVKLPAEVCFLVPMQGTGMPWDGHSEVQVGLDRKASADGSRNRYNQNQAAAATRNARARLNIMQVGAQPRPFIVSPILPYT